MEIKNIIFDLGGVIINLEPMRSIEAFSKICGKQEKELYEIMLSHKQLFIDYETGQIDSKGFRKSVTRIINTEMMDSDFDSAWNSTIFDVPEDRVRLLEQLQKKYRLFLFSNTNEIHVKRLNEILASSSCASRLMDLFEKIYYSHLIQMRKPDPDSFRFILHDQKLVASETLFVDDIYENVEGAKKAGLQVLHVERNQPDLNFLL